MRLIEAIKDAEKDDRIQGILKKDGFLCAAYVTLKPDQDEIKGWELGYYDPQTNQITPVTVTDDFVNVGESDYPMEGRVHEVLKGNVAIPSKEALRMGKEVAGKHQLPIQSIMLSLRKKEDGFEWTVVFITQIMSIIIVRIDAEDGKIKEDSVESLVANKYTKNQGSAS
ncbi:MAG: hypothetical protein HZB68_04185 [Candidatus Aenigmarchaeota archaeon]|nr:hypothetical protein [Candidatus Aenigmarchaeota archaeon]